VSAERGHDTVVLLLLEKGVYLDSKNRDGQTPIWWAAVGRNEAVVKQLLDKGIDPESRDTSSSRTPMF
jgi:ankyrin repeat protein